MSTQKVTFTVFNGFKNDEKAICVEVFRDEEKAAAFNTEYLDSIIKAESGTLCATKAACKSWLLSEIAADSVLWLKGESGNAVETLDLCKTIVSLHRYTNKENLSLRSLYRRNDNDKGYLLNYKLAFDLIDSLPNDLFESSDDEIEYTYSSPY